MSEAANEGRVGQLMAGAFALALAAFLVGRLSAPRGETGATFEDAGEGSVAGDASAPTAPLTSTPGGFVFGETIEESKARCEAARWASEPGPFDRKWEYFLGAYRCRTSVNPVLRPFESTDLSFCEGALVDIKMNGGFGNHDANEGLFRLLAKELSSKYGPQPLRHGREDQDVIFYRWQWPDGGSIELMLIGKKHEVATRAEGKPPSEPTTFLEFTSGTFRTCRSREVDAATHVLRGGL